MEGVEVRGLRASRMRRFPFVFVSMAFCGKIVVCANVL
jgi:hypothetical protein